MQKNPDDLYHIPEKFRIIIFLYFQVLSFADILEIFLYEILNHALNVYVEGEKFLLYDRLYQAPCLNLRQL